MSETEKPATDWKHDGVRVIRGDQLDVNTAQTPGMNRAAAINFARVGAQKIWAGTVTIHPHARTGAGRTNQAKTHSYGAVGHIFFPQLSAIFYRHLSHRPVFATYTGAAGSK